MRTEERHGVMEREAIEASGGSGSCGPATYIQIPIECPPGMKPPLNTDHHREGDASHACWQNLDWAIANDSDRPN